MEANSGWYWLVESGTPESLKVKVDGWARSILDFVKDPATAECLPWIVVEVPRAYQEFLKRHSKDKKKPLPPIEYGVRNAPISDRMGGIITYVLLAPGLRQEYRLARLNLPHYMVLHKDVPEFICRIHYWHETTVGGEYNDVGIRVHPSSGSEATHWPNIDPSTEYCCDFTPDIETFSRVKNFCENDGMNVELSQLFDKLRNLADVYYREGLPGASKDESRGNRGIDLGYTSTRSIDQNIENRGVLDGLSMPSLTAFHTNSETLRTDTYKGAMELLVDFSSHVHLVEPEVYTHPSVPDHSSGDDNCLTIQDLSSRIAEGNRFQAAKFIVTELITADGEFLIPHFDWSNCTHPKNSPVYGINEIYWCQRLSCYLRVCLVVYGRESTTSSLTRYHRMYPLLRRCRVFMENHKPHQINRGPAFIEYIREEVTKMSDLQRRQGVITMSPPHLDKMTNYDGFVDCMLNACVTYDFLNQLHCISFLLCTLVTTNPQFMAWALRNSELVLQWHSAAERVSRNVKEQAVVFGHHLFLHLHGRTHKKTRAQYAHLPSVGGGYCHQNTNHTLLDRKTFRRKYNLIFKEFQYFQSTEYYKRPSKTTKGEIHKDALRLLNVFVNAKPVHISKHLSCLHIVHLGAILQIFPLYFVSWAFVPLETTANETTKRLAREYPGILGRGNKSDQRRESFNLCAAVGYIAGGNANKGEQLICKTLGNEEMEPDMMESAMELISKQWCHNIRAIDGTLFDFFSCKKDLDEFVGREVQLDECIQPLVKTKKLPKGRPWTFYLIRRSMTGELIKVDAKLLANPSTRWNPWKVPSEEGVAPHREGSDRRLSKRMRSRVRCSHDRSESADSSDKRSPTPVRRKLSARETRTRSGAIGRVNYSRQCPSPDNVLVDSSDGELSTTSADISDVPANNCNDEASTMYADTERTSEFDSTTGDGHTLHKKRRTNKASQNSASDEEPEGTPEIPRRVSHSAERRDPIKLQQNLLLLLNKVLGSQFQNLGPEATRPDQDRWGLINNRVHGRLLGLRIRPWQADSAYWSTSIVTSHGDTWTPETGNCDCVPLLADRKSSRVVNGQRFFLSQEASRIYTMLNALLSMDETHTVLELIRPILTTQGFRTSFVCGVPREAPVYPPIHIDLGIDRENDLPDLVLTYNTQSDQNTQSLATITCYHASSFSKVYYLI